MSKACQQDHMSPPKPCRVLMPQSFPPFLSLGFTSGLRDVSIYIEGDINCPSLQSVAGIFRDVSPWWFEILSDWLSRLFITACVYVFAADVDVYKVSKNMWLWWEAVCFLRSIVMEQDLLRHCLPSSKLLKSFRQQVSNHINLWLFLLRSIRRKGINNSIKY